MPARAASAIPRAWLLWAWRMWGRTSSTARRRPPPAAGSRPNRHGTRRTATPSAATRRASSLPPFVTRSCWMSGSRASSRASRRTWFCPPRYSRPESTCRTRTGGEGGEGEGARSGRLPCALARGVAEDLAQLGERERLVQVRPVETLQELEGVAARRVAGGEDDSVRGARVPAGDLGVHLSA